MAWPGENVYVFVCATENRRQEESGAKTKTNTGIMVRLIL